MEEKIKELITLGNDEFRAMCKAHSVKLGPLSAATKKLYAKKLAKAILSVGGGKENVAPDLPRPDIRPVTPPPPPQASPEDEDQPDGMFYAIRTDDNQQLIAHSSNAMRKKLKELKTSLPTFRKFISENEAKQWLDNPMATPQRPAQVTQKYRSPGLVMSGTCESPLRVARSPYQPLGEIRVGSEPKQEWRNMIISKVRENDTDMVEVVFGEIMAQARCFCTQILIFEEFLKRPFIAVRIDNEN